MSRPSQQTNHSDLLGSIYYDVNAMSGFMLGEPTAAQVRLYSDIVNTNGHTDYITGEAQDVANMAALTYDDTTYLNNISKDEWEEGDWFLFGMKSLPWFPLPSDPNNPGGYIRRNNAKFETKFNKARSAVLIPTAITAAKIGGVVVGAYFASKMAYKMMKKKN
jgi:hypothetical protein